MLISLSYFSDWPNQSSKGTEGELDECTPIIVHCYSLSQPGASGDSQIKARTTSGTNNIISKGNPWFLERHTNCINRQPFLKSHKSVRGLQSTEVFYDPCLPCPSHGRKVDNEKILTQPKHVTNDASDVNEDDSQDHSASVLPPGHQHETFMPPVKCRGSSFSSYPLANGYETNCTQLRRSPLGHPSANKGCPKPRHTPGHDPHSEFIHVPNGFHERPPAPYENNHERSGRVTSSDWPNNEISYERRPTVRIQDYYEERRILVGKFYHHIPGPVEVADTTKSSNISYAGSREMIQEDHRRGHFASADVFQRPACENGPFQIQAYEQEGAVGSRKRKNRHPRPQRGKSDGLVQFCTRGQESEEVQYERNIPQEASNERCYPQTNLSSPQDNSMPKKVCCEVAEHMAVRNNKNEVRSREDAQDTIHAQFDGNGRCNANIYENALPRSDIYRRSLPLVSLPPWSNSSESRRIAERNDQQCMARCHLHNVPSPGDTDCSHHPTNHITRDYQMSSRLQSKPSRKSFENAREKTNLENLSPGGRAAQLQCHDPPWMSPCEKHLKALDKEKPSYDNEHERCSSAFPGRSQPDTPMENSNSFPNEMNSESPWSVSVERHEDGLGYRVLQAKDRPPRKNSNAPSSPLPDETRDVSSTVGDDNEESKEVHRRPCQPDLAEPSINDRVPAKEFNKEHNLTFSESRSHFLQNGEMLVNFVNTPSKERRFVCRYCCKKFAHFSTLQNHLRTHTGDKPFQCKFCSRRFAQSGVLKAHLRTHTGDKPFVCIYCRKTFAQSTTLTNHLRTHTGQKPYVCTFCGKSFSQPSTLRKHELSHTKERPYPCKFCGKAFAQQSTLTNHLRSHTGQRPYRCHFCEKSFAQLSTLDRHLRLHSTVSLKPHQCPYCSKSFSYFSNLASHMQVHQEEQSQNLQ